MRKTQKPIARSGLPKKTNPARRRKTSSLPWKQEMKAERLRRNREKEARDYARKYGSEERVKWVKSFACGCCLRTGFTENAHVPPKGEAGTGYKAHYRFIAPLCGRLAPWYSCHARLHDHGAEDLELWSGVNLEMLAAQTEAAWLLFLGSSPGGQT